MRAAARRKAVLLLAIAAAGCSSAQYRPRPLDQEAALAEYAQRDANVDGLRRFAAANGLAPAEWPPAQWGLRELTLVGLYFHPDLRIARARAGLAHAQQAAAGQRPPAGMRVQPEHHSRDLEEEKGPWTLGIEFEIPVGGQSRRDALAQRGAFLADAADLDVAAAAWRVRAGVRDRLLEVQSARDALSGLEARVAAQREIVALIERRFQAGLLSSQDLASEKLALAQAEAARDEQADAAGRAISDLALALGVPLEVARPMVLRFPGEAAPVQTDPATLQRLALKNRLDVHRRLLEFGAADAEVKLAIASQNPGITLGPGYAWDQGDNVWSLAVGMSLPSPARARAQLREGEAQREVAAQQFLATQVDAVAATGAAAAGYRAAQERLESARGRMAQQQAQEARVQHQFDAGSADRLQRTQARMETLLAEGAVHRAALESRRALGRLEDAVQRPLFGDFDNLPDMRAAGAALPPRQP
ncbi:MAG TPA: TolC family protein [Burkholderiales bacterium]|nr:TolC family protein [Burkholderiales bacterium]